MSSKTSKDMDEKQDIKEPIRASSIEAEEVTAMLNPAAPRPANVTTNSNTSNENNGNGNTHSSVSITVNPMESRVIVNPLENRISSTDEADNGGAGDEPQTAAQAGERSPGTESPGTSQLSPPPSYHDIPGTVPAHQGVSRGPPPSYEDAVDPNAEPPSYDSLFGMILDTHKTSRNCIDFLAKLLLLLLGTIGCTIACSVTVVIPICMIAIGARYFNDCPVEPNIPIFLVVGGSLSVFKYLIGVITRIRHNENSQDQPPTTPIQSFITLFLCGFFITGCVWVYRVYQPDFDEAHRGQPNYCNKTVYVFAFWIITTAYIFLGLFTSCICCFSIVSVILKKD